MADPVHLGPRECIIELMAATLSFAAFQAQEGDPSSWLADDGLTAAGHHLVDEARMARDHVIALGAHFGIKMVPPGERVLPSDPTIPDHIRAILRLILET